jgi:hypothetical protein
MAQSTIRYPVPETGSGLARRTATGVLLSVVLVLLAQGIVDALSIDVGATGSMSPFAAGPLVGATIVAGAGAAVAYAAAVKFTDQPVRNFVALAAGVFVIMLGPVFLAPPEGITTVGQAILVLYHALVAVPLVAFITGAVEA